MANRKIRPKEEATDTTIPSVESELTSEQVAAYLRQSTTRQTIENLESKELQLTGAQRFAVSQGLDADKIVVQWEGEGKRGVSGTKRIDQRERLSEIMDGIREGKIKIVWAYSVSRLFRDKFGVQVGTFIEACAEHGVRVVIGQMTFDFSNYMYVMMFQMLASQAAQENELRSKLMSEGRSNKAKRGEYDGRPIIAGYIVDRKDKSETFGKYVPYEPHAEIVRWLYRRYSELDGRFNVLAREVARMPVLFPDFDKSVDKRNVHRLLLKRFQGVITSQRKLFSVL